MGSQEQDPNYGISIIPCVHKGESIRVFPLSNWTELDIWQYIRLENIPIVPLYFAKERPIVNIDGNLIMVDDDRMPEAYRKQAQMMKVRFRTFGCYRSQALRIGSRYNRKNRRRNDDDNKKANELHELSTLTKKPVWNKKKREGYF